MARSLLDDIIKTNDLRSKRKHLQRKLVFSEPVMSLSLDKIGSNTMIERTDMITDSMGLISDLPVLSEEDVRRFHEAGYFRESDVKNTRSGQISSEVNLPWRAIREVEQMIDGETGFSFTSGDQIVETVSKDEAVRSLMNSTAWVSILLFEHRMRTSNVESARQIMSDSERSSRKYLIENMYKSSRRAEAHTKKIARFTNCSEQYVKDVISGRVQEGLSEKERKSILERDEYKCRNCESESELEVHHIIPVSQDGTKDESNLCTLCSNCHLNIAHGGNTAEVTYTSKDEFWNLIEED